MIANEDFQRADALKNRGAYVEAAELYCDLAQKQREMGPFCLYRLAAIMNINGDPLKAYDLYYKAFSAKPDLAADLYGDGYPNRSYVFKGKKDEQELSACPLCGNFDVHPKWCYPLSEASGYNPFFNPIRLWMYCEPCHHVFARFFPEKLFIYNNSPRVPDPAFFAYYSNVLSRIKQHSEGMSLLEVGIGACECLLVAREMGFDVFGIDVIERHVQMAHDIFKLDAQTADFVEFQCDKKFDIIIMGDVIEHVSDPTKALKNAYDLLYDNGALWVSTPNFDSAFSLVTEHQDPMRRQQYHLNYFSRKSFNMLLNKCGFTLVDYSVSTAYKGSMEIIAVKTAR
ncbi:MAG: class I SAM-dependent methyltransferase [Holophagales bacterium]|jgi:2-polyprenyl-3-methyl-5-hydroxy-6-metoxy-1,4-benzoquinol methylase|nr:class I SAM-dependent methyltransferase [Holophagales bacterium]